MVDLVGIEPTTSSMPWKRAPSCATGPHLYLLFSPTKVHSSNQRCCGTSNSQDIFLTNGTNGLNFRPVYKGKVHFKTFFCLLWEFPPKHLRAFCRNKALAT